MSRSNKERWPKCAAVYVRMSTELQQYSTSNQMDVICVYAKNLGFTIVKEYSDLGKSGLNIEGREALEQMLSDVQEGRAEYSAIRSWSPKSSSKSRRWAHTRSGTRSRNYWT